MPTRAQSYYLPVQRIFGDIWTLITGTDRQLSSASFSNAIKNVEWESNRTAMPQDPPIREVFDGL